MLTTRTLTLAPMKQRHANDSAIHAELKPIPHRDLQSSHARIESRDCRDKMAYFLTADLDSGTHATELAAAHGLNLQILFPKEPLPIVASAMLVALDELLLDAHERRRYLGELRKLDLPYPVFVLSYDFQLEPLTIERPGFILAARLEDEVLHTLKNG